MYILDSIRADIWSTMREIDNSLPCRDHTKRQSRIIKYDQSLKL
jgi:hypothetical protein